jgi:hypothetical protein
MEVIEITKISDKLKDLDSQHFQEISDFIDHLHFDSNDFQLTDKQKEILDKRIKTPRNLFVTKEEFLQRIKEKYEL